MRAMKTYLLMTSLFFAFAGTVHVVRLVLGWQITVSGWAVPMGVSTAAVIVCGALCLWGLRLFSKGLCTIDGGNADAV
jgi:hypothetical protein